MVSVVYQCISLVPLSVCSLHIQGVSKYGSNEMYRMNAILLWSSMCNVLAVNVFVNLE